MPKSLLQEDCGECCHRCSSHGRNLALRDTLALDSNTHRLCDLEGGRFLLHPPADGLPPWGPGLTASFAPRPPRRLCSPRIMCLVTGFFLGLLVTTSCFLTIAVQSCVHHVTLGCRQEAPLLSPQPPQPPQPLQPKQFSLAFWPAAVEALRPSGFDERHHNSWRQRVAALRVARIQPGCGRMHNRMVVLEDGSVGCMRYRVNTDQIQGEIFTYHLARLLGINNIPPSILIRLNAQAPAWQAVREQYAAAEWEEGRLAVFAEWVPGLRSAFIPPAFRRSDLSASLPPTVSHLLLRNGTAMLSSAAESRLRELLQWTDMLALDYLTANLDRFVNSLINRQWNDQIMSEPAHNLEVAPDRGLLVFLDNESGLFHGYRLLSKYHGHYEAMLRLTCLFRRPLVEKLRGLPKDAAELERRLSAAVMAADPLADQLPRLTRENAGTLASRIQALLKHVDRCQGQA